MPNELIRHLKERKLHEVGVPGAKLNPNRFSPRKINANWNVIDCQTYLVHVLDEPTREALRLEELWSGEDPVWNLDYQDEDAVDEYVANHPVPANYGQQFQSLWDISRLERNKLAPHKPVVSKEQQLKDQRAGRKRRRQRRNDGLILG